MSEENYMLDFSIARGLDYYTGTVYETTITDHPEFGSVCSGGRYDNLLGKYGKNAPSIGFSIVLEDLLSALYRQNVSIEREDKCEVITFTKENFKEALVKASELRAKGKDVALIQE